MKSLLLVLMCGFALSAYSEEDAIWYTWVSSFAYCNDLGVDNCGNSSKAMKDYGIDLVEYK